MEAKGRLGVEVRNWRRAPRTLTVGMMGARPMKWGADLDCLLELNATCASGRLRNDVPRPVIWMANP